MIKPLNRNPPLDCILSHGDVGNPSSHFLVIVMINVTQCTHSIMGFKLHLDVFLALLVTLLTLAVPPFPGLPDPDRY